MLQECLHIILKHQQLHICITKVHSFAYLKICRRKMLTFLLSSTAFHKIYLDVQEGDMGICVCLMQLILIHVNGSWLAMGLKTDFPKGIQKKVLFKM